MFGGPPRQTIEFDPGRRRADQGEIADDFVPHAGEDPDGAPKAGTATSRSAIGMKPWSVSQSSAADPILPQSAGDGLKRAPQLPMNCRRAIVSSSDTQRRAASLSRWPPAARADAMIAALDVAAAEFEGLGDPPPSNWSTRKYVFEPRGRPRCQGNVTSRKRGGYIQALVSSSQLRR